MKKYLNLELIYLLLAALLPIIFTFTWLNQNNQLPGNDAANYLMTAVNIYHSFTDHGIVSGLLHSYMERGWRPISFPLILIPFMIFLKGSLYNAYFLAAMLCLFSSIVYVYLFFRLRLDRISATIATTLVGLLPLIQAQIVMFYAEAALFPCMIGIIYHLIKSDYLQNTKHTCGFIILFILAVTLRPIEAVTNLLFVLLTFLILGYRKKIFKLAQMYKLFFIAVFAMLIFFVAALVPYLHFKLVPVMDAGGMLDKKMAKMLYHCLIGAIGFTCFMSIPYLIIYTNGVRAKFNLHNGYSNKPLIIPTFFIITFFVLLWFLPFAAETFQWIYRTSLGDVATGTGLLTGSRFSWTVLQLYVLDEGLLPILGIILVALIAWFEKEKKTILSLPVIYLLMTIPFPFWEAFYTVQIITRKLSIAFPALLMALLFVGLARGQSLNYRRIIIFSLCMVQFGLLMISNCREQRLQHLVNYTIGSFIHQPVIIYPNPHDVVINFLDEQAAYYKIKAFGLEVIPGTPDARHPIEAQPINPFLLSTMLAAAKKTYYANYLYFGTYSKNNISDLRQHYDAIFLADKIENMLINPKAATEYQQKYLHEINPSIKIFYEFLLSYANNNLLEIGWRLGPCQIIKTQSKGDYLACLLLSEQIAV